MFRRSPEGDGNGRQEGEAKKATEAPQWFYFPGLSPGCQRSEWSAVERRGARCGSRPGLIAQPECRKRKSRSQAPSRRQSARVGVEA